MFAIVSALTIGIGGIGSGGCVAVDEDAGEALELGDESYEVTMLLDPEHSDPTQDVWLGLKSAVTCFLRGASGDFRGDPRLGATAAKPASVEVFTSGSSWYGRVRKGTGKGVRAHIQCIGVPYAGLRLEWADNNPSLLNTLPDAAGRHCFLSKIWATSGLGGVGPQGTTTNLTLTRQASGNGTEWKLSGSVSNVDGDAQFGGAEAVCVDVPGASSYGPFSITGPTNQSNSAIDTDIIDVSNTTGACGLTKIKGKWQSPAIDPLGILDGVYLNSDTQGFDWEFTATNGRGGSARCLK